MSELDIDTVSFNDKRVEINSFDRYKGRKNVVDRITVLSSSLMRARQHYYEPKRRSFRCLGSKDGSIPICCKQLGDAEQKFGMVLFQYSTDETGALLSEEKLVGKVKLWVVSDSRYTELSQIHREFPLMDGGFTAPQVDLISKCTEEQWQRMVFTPCRDAFWKRKKEWFDAMKMKEQKARFKLLKAMGAEMTELEVMELLDISSHSNPSMGLSGDVDIGDDVLE